MDKEFSRRDFLKVAGTGAAAVAVGNALVKPQGALAASAASPASQAPQSVPNPQMQAVLDELASLNAPPLTSVVPRVARELPSFQSAVLSLLSKQGKPCVEQVGKVAHQVIKGPGGQILMRIYSPQGSGPFPVLVYFHGGGWVIADINVYDASPRALVNAANCIVVSVAYRQAPEFPFPGAPLDCFTAYQWVLANAAYFGGDPNRVAVGGESAGGNLAAVTALMARDKGVRLPVHQLLVYPVTSTWYGAPERVFPSYQENQDTKPLSTPALGWFYRYYLRNKGDSANPYASPLRATSLKGLPAATVINADIDPLRDEGEAYKSRLAADGVAVTGTRYTGVTHEFFGMGAVVDVAKQAVAEAALNLKKSFGTA